MSGGIFSSRDEHEQRPNWSSDTDTHFLRWRRRRTEEEKFSTPNFPMRCRHNYWATVCWTTKKRSTEGVAEGWTHYTRRSVAVIEQNHTLELYSRMSLWVTQFLHRLLWFIFGNSVFLLRTVRINNPLALICLSKRVKRIHSVAFAVFNWISLQIVEFFRFKFDHLWALVFGCWVLA